MIILSEIKSIIMATRYVEKSENSADKISTTPHSEAVCLLQWGEKDGRNYIGTGFLAVDEDSRNKQVYFMSAGHNFENLNFSKQTIPADHQVGWEDYQIKFNYTKPIDSLYKMNLREFLTVSKFKEDQILFGRCIEDNKADSDFMIVPLGVTIEELKGKFEKIDAIAISKEKKALLDSSKLDFYIIGHPNSKNDKEVIQKATCGKVREPEDLKADCRKEERKTLIEMMKTTKLFHHVDTIEGSSGSPLMFFGNYQWNVAGIHVGGFDRMSFLSRRHVNYAEYIFALLRNQKEEGKPFFCQKPYSSKGNLSPELALTCFVLNLLLNTMHIDSIL